MIAIRGPWLSAYAVVATVHLVLNVADAGPWDSISKCLLAPLLLAWTLRANAPRLLSVALVCCFFGDLFLELSPRDTWFPAGMAAFAVAHVCFIALFTRYGAARMMAKRPWVPLVFLVLACLLLWWVWSGLDPSLRPLIPGYAALLAVMASFAVLAGARTGIGGVLFLVSDSIIALHEAGRWTAHAPGFWIMLLYAASILVLADSITALERRSRRTDCWPVPPTPEPDRNF